MALKNRPRQAPPIHKLHKIQAKIQRGEPLTNQDIQVIKLMLNASPSKKTLEMILLKEAAKGRVKLLEPKISKKAKESLKDGD